MHQLTRLSLDHPKATLAILLAVTAFLALGLPRVRTEFGYRVLVADDHPSIQALDALIAQFGGGLPVQIAWSCGGEGDPCSNVFDEASLQMVETVTRDLAAAEGIQAVRGPSNAPLLTPSAGGFAVRRFVERGQIVDDVDSLAARALDDDLWAGSLVSADGHVGVIVAQPVDTRSETDVLVVEHLEEVLQPFRERGFDFRLSGQAIGQVYSGRELDESSGSLIPFTVLVIAVVVFMLCRSWQQTLASLATMGLALLWATGLMGWLDWPKDGIHEVLAPLILVVGVCDAMHLVARYSVLRRAEPTRLASLVGAAREVGTPCLVTSLTTAAAFLSFTTSALDTFVRFGVISSFGVLACLLLTFTLLPIALLWLPDSGGTANRVTDRWRVGLESVIGTSRRHARPILALSVVAFMVFAYGWAVHLRVDNDWNEGFGSETQVMRWISFFETHLEEADTVELELSLPDGVGFANPEALAIVSRIAERIEETPPFVSTRSIVDLLSRLNQLLHDDDPSYYRIGDDTASNAELIELLSLDDSTVVNSWLSLDRSRLRLSVGTPDLSFSRAAAALGKIDEILDELLPEGWSAERSGEVAITVDWMRDVQSTQLRSFPTALAVVFLMIAIHLHSARLAAIALLPTILPVVVTLGAMGWLGFSLDIGRTMIAAVMIGIGVDDAIHLLGEYRTRLREGDPPKAAIIRAATMCGPAIVTSSVALSSGFLTLLLSAWEAVSGFGLFAALAIAASLGTTVVVLPAAILLASDRESRPRARLLVNTSPATPKVR